MNIRWEVRLLGGEKKAVSAAVGRLPETELLCTNVSGSGAHFESVTLNGEEQFTLGSVAVELYGADLRSEFGPPDFPAMDEAVTVVIVVSNRADREIALTLELRKFEKGRMIR